MAEEFGSGGTDEALAGDLIPAERQARLRDWFAVNGAGSNQDLARLMGASVSTIRRDLDQLAVEGLVRRTHGGAVAVRRRATYEPTAEAARATAVEEKRAIALEAARRLEPDQSVMLDTGSTMNILAELIAGMDMPLTVVTSDLRNAAALACNSHIRLVVPGGTCRARAFTLLGEPGLGFLSELRCDRLFLTAQALDGECVSDTHLDLVTLKRAMLATARATTLLIDSSRVSDRAIYRIAGLDEIEEVISDEGLSEAEARLLAERGLKVTRARLDEGMEEQT